MITPTPGRIVWFTPAARDTSLKHDDKTQPLAAIIACVHDERTVTLSVIDQRGVPHPRPSVALLQDDDQPSPLGYYAQWIPYQAKQAEKAAGPRREARELAINRLSPENRDSDSYLKEVARIAHFIENGTVEAAA
jgi:hypothetical protein